MLFLCGDAMAREFAKAFYNSKLWQQTRDYIMMRDGYMCQCHKIFGGEPCGEPAQEVHHIIWLNPKNINDANITLNPDNLIAVSTDCHFRIHKVQRLSSHTPRTETSEGYHFNKEGLLVPEKKVYLVTGCYGSGKSYYVKEHMTKGDLVVDMDLLFMALSYDDMHSTDDKLLKTVWDTRDYLYKHIKERKGDWITAWVTAALPDINKRKEVTEYLGAENIHIDVSKDICISNILRDTSRIDKGRFLKLVDDYYSMGGGYV